MKSALSLHAVPNAEGKTYVKLPPEKQVKKHVSAWREIIFDEVRAVLTDNVHKEEWMRRAGYHTVDALIRAVHEGLLVAWSERIFTESVRRNDGNILVPQEAMMASVEDVLELWHEAPAHDNSTIAAQIEHVAGDYLERIRPCTLRIAELRERMRRIVEGNRIERHEGLDFAGVHLPPKKNGIDLSAERILDPALASELYVRHRSLRRSEQIVSSLLFQEEPELYERNRELWRKSQNLPTEYGMDRKAWLGPSSLEEIRTKIQKYGAFFMHYSEEKIRERIRNPKNWIIVHARGKREDMNDPKPIYAADMHLHVGDPLEFHLPDVRQFGSTPPGFTMHSGLEIAYEISDDPSIAACTADICTEDAFAGYGLMGTQRNFAYSIAREIYPRLNYSVAEVGSVKGYQIQNGRYVEIPGGPIRNWASEVKHLKTHWDSIIGWDVLDTKVPIPLLTDDPELPPSYFVMDWRAYIHKFQKKHSVQEA